MSQVDTISLLNRLIVRAKDGESSLRAAAEEAYHEEVRQALLEYSRFCGDSARALQDAVVQLGGQPRAIGTFGNTVHRTWMHLKVGMLGRDEATILDEVEPDEEHVEDLLADAVHRETPPELHALLEQQYQRAQQHHTQLRQLRTRLQPST